MNEFETDNGADDTNDCEDGNIDAQLTGGVANCGTPTTPPCPLARVYVARNALIYRLAGPNADRRRVARVARRVDEYLVTVLQGAFVLDQTTDEPSRREPAPDADYRVEVDVVEVIVK